MTTQFKKQKYKGFTIIVREQKPNVKEPTTEKEWDKLHENTDLLEVCGTHGYEILNKQGEILGTDIYDMWDYGACFENAKQDIKTGWVQDYKKRK